MSSIFNTTANGPLALSGSDGTRRGQGVPMRLHGSTFARGDVIEFASYVRNDAITKLTTDLRTATGLLQNGHLVDEPDNGFYGVQTMDETIADGGEGKVVLFGEVYASIFFEDSGGSVSTAIPFGADLYIVDGEKYLTANASLSGATVGKKVGKVLQNFAAGARTAAAASTALIAFSGIPDHLK